MTSLRGKTAVVTGGSSGVGKATVKALISRGARVTAIARGAERLRALEAEVGDRVATLPGDAADPALAQRILREVKPDLVVLAAGVMPPINGSPASGGYAGAKRMQWVLAGYAKKVADAKKLGIRVLAVLPKQLIEGTTIGARAAATYGAMNGTTAEAYMKRWDVPLDVEKVAAAILTALEGGVPAEVNAIAVTGVGIEPLP